MVFTLTQEGNLVAVDHPKKRVPHLKKSAADTQVIAEKGGRRSRTFHDYHKKKGQEHMGTKLYLFCLYFEACHFNRACMVLIISRVCCAKTIMMPSAICSPQIYLLPSFPPLPSPCDPAFSAPLGLLYPLTAECKTRLHWRADPSHKKPC